MCTYLWVRLLSARRGVRHALLMSCAHSGMGDYPRTRGTDVTKDAHVDLTSWVAMMFRLLTKLEHAARGVDGMSLEGEWKMGEELLSQHIEAVHWSQEAGTYQDRGRAEDKTSGTSHVEFANHEGYASMMPLMMGLIPDGTRSDSVLQPVMRHFFLCTCVHAIRERGRRIQAAPLMYHLSLWGESGAPRFARTRRLQTPPVSSCGSPLKHLTM